MGTRSTCWLGALLASATAGAWAQPAALPGVVVEAASLPAGLRRAEINTLSGAPLAETPLSAGVIDAEEMRSRGVQSLSQAIRTEPSVGDGYNTVGFVESLVVRGFRLDSLLNYRRDGLPVSNYAPLATENLEAIEIVNGLAAAIGAGGTPGGLVNYRVKRPTDLPLAFASLEISERGSVLAQGDFGGRFGAGNAFGYRINVAAGERRPYAEDADGRRGFASGWFDWRLNERTTLVAEFDYSAVRQVSVPGFGLVDSDGDGVAETLPAPISPRQNLNAQPWSQPFDSRAGNASLRWLQELGSDWGLELRAAGQRIDTDDRVAFPDGCSAGAAYVYPGMCANGDMDLYDYRSEGERRRTGTLDAVLAGRLHAGGLAHELRLGARRTRYTERYPPLQAYNFVGFTNAYAPPLLPADPTPTTPTTSSSLDSVELAASDVLRAGPASLWLGARWVRLDRASARSDGAEATAFTQDFAVPWLAAGWQPWSGGFGYVSWGQGVEIESVPNRPQQFVNSGEVLPALKSEQLELGFKQVWPRGDALILALFSIDKPYGDDLVQPDGRLLRVGGARESRHRGVEAGGVLVAAPSLRVQAKAAWIDARTTRAVDPARIDKRTPNVAPFAAALSATWQVPAASGLQLSSLLAYSAAKPVTADNTVELSPYWQWDLTATCRWTWAGARMAATAGLENVTDNRYWRQAPTEAWGGTYLFPAPPRLARLSVSASW